MQFKHMAYAASVVTVFCAAAISVCAQSAAKPSSVEDKLAQALTVGNFIPAVNAAPDSSSPPRSQYVWEFKPLALQNGSLVVGMDVAYYRPDTFIEVKTDSTANHRRTVYNGNLKIAMSDLEQQGFTAVLSGKEVHVYKTNDKTTPLPEAAVQEEVKKAFYLASERANKEAETKAAARTALLNKAKAAAANIQYSQTPEVSVVP